MTASLSACSARSGRCSENFAPLMRVSMALNSPPVFVPGLGSNVSMWLGPPFIQRRMQALPRPFLPVIAACSAARSCQAGIAALRTAPRPLAMNDRRPNADDGPQQLRVLVMSVASMVRQEFAAVEECPVEVFVSLFFGGAAAALLGEDAEGGFGGEFAEGADVQGSVGVVAHFGV